ncbi:MAG: hypothetical protein K940chlam9_00117 [Chlamydiae bacterium]|nr:hypothetical protein [Chlamydiota bacterium]
MSLTRSDIIGFVQGSHLPQQVFHRGVTQEEVNKLNGAVNESYTLQEVAAAVNNRAQPQIQESNSYSGDVEGGDSVENPFEELTNYPFRKNFLVANPLSAFWSKRAVEEKKENLVTLGMLYIPGMIGYALSLVVRVTILAWRILQVIGTFFQTLFRGEFSLLGSEIKYRLLILAGSASSVGAGALGTVCPPLGYYLDDKIHENGCFHQHAYFNLQADGSGDVLEALLTGVTDRVSKKGNYLNPYGKYFRKAVHTLKQNIKGEEVSAAIPATLEQVSLLGILYAVKDSLKANSGNPFVFITEYLKEFEIEGIDLETLGDCWRFVEKNNVDEAIHYIETKTILRDDVGNKDYLEGKREALESSLVSNMDFENVYNALSDVVGSLNREDREFYIGVTALSAVQYL